MSHILGMELDSEFGFVSGSGSDEKIWVQTGSVTPVTYSIALKAKPIKSCLWGGGTLLQI